jgi:hypothetical protein
LGHCGCVARYFWCALSSQRDERMTPGFIIVLVGILGVAWLISNAS